MNPSELDRFREVEEIFYAAIDRPAGVERDTLIRDRCGADENLHTEVSLLLEDHERIRAAVPASTKRFPRFGAWQTVKLLGRGGMGTVYLAERADGAFRMSAAVKVVPLALASHEIEERFRRERQFLASLEHPKIARLIDGGVSETGLPYLVMEFVGGLSIDRFCDTHALDIRSRIALFRQVLDALTYVHGRQVLHRDVKPSNILVDESGNVKLLDFGTARLLDSTGEAALTKTGVFAFTPEYASPEQVRGDPLTVASDLYSTGVLLYRLLTGRLPYRISELSRSGIARMVERAQPDPSGLDAPLDAILSKALRKDSAARYPSARDMDADLARYLEGQRVHARKPRPKAWAALAAAIVLCVSGFVGLRWLRPPQHSAALVPFDAGVPNPMEPALSYDGNALAFASARDAGARSDIWMKRMPDGPPRRVTDVDAINDEPSLSPDGRWLAFHSTRAPAGIYLQPLSLAASGSPAKLLVEGGRVPRFSPDGRWISYMNAGESGADLHASNSSVLYRIPVHGGTPIRLARNVASVMGSAWTADGRSLLILAIDEALALQLWSVPADGEPAALIPDFVDLPHGDGLVCGVTQDRLLYTAFEGDNTRALEQFLLKPVLGGNRLSRVPGPQHSVITTCTASANGSILAGEATSQSGIWVLPLTAETGEVHGPPVPLTQSQPGPQFVQFTSDGASFLVNSSAGGYLQDYRTGVRRPIPTANEMSSDGVFVLETIEPAPGAQTGSRKVLNLKTGELGGLMQTGAVAWDLSRGGQWMLAASVAVHRTILVWDTKTAEHHPIYALPRANLYLANFTADGKWVLFTSEQSGEHPRMWAAPFRGFENIPVSEWVDLGEGDYPRWSPGGGRIYFTLRHDGFECIFTRAVDRRTKRPVGPVIAVQHFHERLTPRGVPAGSFRISVAQDKISFTLGERLYRLYRRQ